MTAAAVAVGAIPRRRAVPARLVIARHIFRSSMLWALVWGAVFGLLVLSSSQGYIKAFPTISGRLQLLQGSQSFAFLAGEPIHIETVAGYTVWKVLTTTVFIGAIWGLRTSTGLLRGEEESGRWELLLTGSTTRRRAALEALLGLGAALLVMFAITAALTLGAGSLPGARFSIDGSLLFAVAMVSAAAMFLAIGALASQVAETSSQAGMLASLVLGVSYAMRVVADSSHTLGWLRWWTPLGWIEELRPLVPGSQLMALAPIAAVVLVCAALTVILAGQRDLNGSVLREPEGQLGNPRLLVGPTTLAVRLSRTAALAWVIGLAGYSGLLGSVTRAATSFLSNSPTAIAALGRLGIKQAGEGFVAIIIFMSCAAIAVLAATQMGTVREEEATGRLDNLLVRPVPRVVWLGGRVFVSLALVLLTGLATGFATWLGVANQHTGVSLPAMLEAGLNASVPGVLVVGAGTFVMGVRPRFTAVVCFAMVAWSMLIYVLGAVIKNADWLRDSSLFTHIAAAPAAKPDWGTDLTMVLIAIGLAAIGAIAFQRRDIEYA